MPSASRPTLLLLLFAQSVTARRVVYSFERQLRFLPLICSVNEYPESWPRSRKPPGISASLTISREFDNPACGAAVTARPGEFSRPAQSGTAQFRTEF